MTYAYAVLGGADFGAGIWDPFSLGLQQQDEKRQLIVHAVGPVWEANNVWLIYLVVGLYTAFPLVAAMLATALLLSFGLALLGIVLRGAAFAFHEHSQSDKHCAAALLCLIGALFFLSVVVFTFIPTSPAGLVSTALGALSMFGCIFFFVRYHTSLKREKRE